MRTSKQHFGFGHTTIALAVLMAFGPARAQDIGELTAPGNSIGVGLGVASGSERDRARFGMFNGMRTQDFHGLFGFSYLDRDNGSGKWFTLEGRNLGLDNREVSFSYRKLGDMKLWGEYSELVRHDPRTINTGLIGAGTTTPTVVQLSAPGTGGNLNLDLKRKSFSLNAEKWFGGELQMELNFKNEDKDGARFFGRGFTCPSASAPSPICGTPLPGGIANQWALLMLPEPVNSTIRQFDAKLNWSGEKLRLSGGYYGSFYTNANGNLTASVPGATLVNGLGTPVALDAGLRGILQLPMSLWPDNQAQQLYLGGNYTLTPKTKLNFKYSFTHATQNEDFLGMGLTGAPGGRGNLGGVVDTTRAQIGFSSHPLDKLHLHGDLKYDSKNNKTPVALYNIEGANTFTNGTPSPKKLDGKLEANYRLPANYNVTGAVFHETDDHGTWTPTDAAGGISGIRQKLKETGYRLELGKNMSETLTGRLSFVSSRREGTSSWLKPNAFPLTGVFPADANCTSATVAGVPNACIYGRTSIFPFIYEDRDRDKVRLMANWNPTDRLSLTLFVENGKDKFRGPTEHGLRDSGMRMFSADAAYAMTDTWKLTGYISRGEQTVNAGHSTGYDATLRDTNNSAGIGLLGKPSQRLRLGADVTYLNDVLKYQQTVDPLGSATNQLFLAEQGGLPDVTYRLLRLKLFSEYALDKTSHIRLDLIHQRTLFNEWTYSFNGTPFRYSDNTTLSAVENQSVTYVGASYVFRFQ